MRTVLVSLLALASAACTGSIGDNVPGVGGPGDDPANQQPGACTDEPTLVEPYLRRLTVRETLASLADVLGPLDTASVDLPPDTYLDGFDNNETTLRVSTLHVDRYLKLGTSVAGQILGDAARRDAVFGCDASSAACIETFVRETGRRLYRRPLLDEEVASLLALAAEADGDPDPFAGASLVIQAMVQSPQFLYRAEIGVEDPSDPSRRLLTGHEMAARLSYLVWGSTPPDWLLDLADAGALDDAAGVASAARDLALDPRAREGLGTFLAQWLRLPLLDEVARSTAQYPSWSEELRSAMGEETRRLLLDFVFDDDKRFLDALRADYTYADPALAALYGVDVAGDGFERVSLASHPERRGLLTHASVLTLGGTSERVAPILRGKYVRDVFLCTPVPPPPKNVPDIPPPEPGESVREGLSRHRTDPACAACHGMLDPLGFGFERYDLIGAYREVDASGNLLTGEGEVSGLEPAAFTGPIELGARLAEEPTVAACVATQMLRFAAGRTEEGNERCDMDRLGRATLAADGDLVGMIVEFVSSETFRTVGAPR